MTTTSRTWMYHQQYYKPRAQPGPPSNQTEPPHTPHTAPPPSEGLFKHFKETSYGDHFPQITVSTSPPYPRVHRIHESTVSTSPPPKPNIYWFWVYFRKNILITMDSMYRNKRYTLTHKCQPRVSALIQALWDRRNCFGLWSLERGGGDWLSPWLRPPWLWQCSHINTPRRRRDGKESSKRLFKTTTLRSEQSGMFTN